MLTFETLLPLAHLLGVALGSTIDKVIEPKFLKLAPVPGESPSPEFIRIQKRYLIAEVTATGSYYVIVVMWLLF